jgi:GT2 family glycosyltransferase
MTPASTRIERVASEPNESPSVWTVVVHYGDPAVTSRVLGLLATATSPMSIVVVDNGGNFQPPTGVRYVRMAQNVGFAGGANAGARLALSEGAEFVWFLNNDAEPEPDALERLLRRARSSRAASIVGSLEIDFRDQEPGSLESYLLPGLPRSLTGAVRVVGGPARSVDFLSGFSMLVSRSAFELVGSFDETYFHYCEDVDFVLRAHQLGVDIVLDAGAPLKHTRSSVLGSGSRIVAYYYFRNRLLLLSRHRHLHPLLTLFIAAPERSLWPLVSPAHLTRRDWSWLAGSWRGTLDAIRGHRGKAPTQLLGRPPESEGSMARGGTQSAGHGGRSS